jgi:hypothetical protein
MPFLYVLSWDEIECTAHAHVSSYDVIFLEEEVG